MPVTTPFIEISNQPVQFARLAASQTCKVNTNMDDIKCEVTSGADWCQASYANEVLTIAVVSNHAYQSRTGTVTLVGGDIKATVTITQDGKGSSIGQVGDDL